MPDAPFTAEDIELAWRRVMWDIESSRVFFRHPLEMELVRVDLDGWLSALHTALASGVFRPRAITVCDVPKAKAALRPGGYLPLAEQTVYAAAVGACLPQVQEAVRWSKNAIDFSYHLANNPKDARWLQSRFPGWKQFRIESLKQLDTGFSYVVCADLVGYYDSIDLRTLFSDLAQLGPPHAATGVLTRCLTYWAQVRGRGIPQGFSASDILGKLYLSRVDMAFAQMGYTHYRYVDDFRIFCRTRSEAKRAVVDLTRLLRARGLSLHSGKTRVLRADEARTVIDGVIPTLKSIRDGFVRKVAESDDFSAAYLTLEKADEFLDAHGDGAPVELLEHAYQTFFIDDTGAFDKTLFHFLLKRLGRAQSRFALEHCKSLLESHPEETDSVLQYFGDVSAVADMEDVLASYMTSDDAVYQYQLAKIVEWRALFEVPTPTEQFTAAVRHLCFLGSSTGYLKAVCRYYLGRFGSLADLERLEQQYPDASGDLDRSEILCALHRMEKARRNTLLAAVEGDGEMIRRACRLVRSGQLR